MTDKKREAFEKWATDRGVRDKLALETYWSMFQTMWQVAHSEQAVPEGWIPVSERLPDSGVSFLAVTDCAGDIHISTMRLPVLIAKNEKQSGEFIRERVTHWMPLPEVPQPNKEPRHD